MNRPPSRSHWAETFSRRTASLISADLASSPCFVQKRWHFVRPLLWQCPGGHSAHHVSKPISAAAAAFSVPALTAPAPRDSPAAGGVFLPCALPLRTSS